MLKVKLIRLIRNSSIILYTVWFFISCSRQEFSPAPFQVYSLIDSTEANIGDVLEFQVWVNGSGDKVIQFPDLMPFDQNLSLGERKELTGEYKDHFGIAFEVTFWDTGNFVIPSYSVNILTADRSKVDYVLSTDPVKVEILSVITDPNPVMRDLKPPVPIPLLLPSKIISTVIGILALTGLIMWLWKKREKASEEKRRVVVPLRPPFSIAMEKLNSLKGYGLSSYKEKKKFYTELSFIVREFIENQFFLKALEMTTEEILWLKDIVPAESELFNQVLEVLKRSDLSKFAKFEQTQTQCQEDLALVELFLNSTKIDFMVKHNISNQMEKSYD